MSLCEALSSSRRFQHVFQRVKLYLPTLALGEKKHSYTLRGTKMAKDSGRLEDSSRRRMWCPICCADN